MRKKINWGYVCWGVLVKIHVASATLFAIKGDYVAASGWAIAALFIIAFRKEANECDYWYESSGKWSDRAFRMVFKVFDCQKQIKDCQREINELKEKLEKVNGKENND